ncbi:MAG TPA: PilX N-terminal domain-containing pilus assembly protein [Pseudoxanthomonas sp.]|nr:PilX N-terminal domain-containing pilus assembly protein [Pseudoxanthomonas sp.]
MKFMPAKRLQQGAVLYVALIMLILLALIGIVGMQVATLQERMSTNYVAANVAFQRAESVVRTVELEIAGGGVFENENCANPFNPRTWAANVTTAKATRTARIGICAGECSASVGSDESESLCNLYRITGFSRDRDAVGESSSLAAIDTFFIKP